MPCADQRQMGRAACVLLFTHPHKYCDCYCFWTFGRNCWCICSLSSAFALKKQFWCVEGWKRLPLQLRCFTLFLLFLFFTQFFLWMSNDPFSLAFFLPLLCCEIRIKSNSAIVVTFCMVMHCADSVGVFFPHLLFSVFQRQLCSASLSSKKQILKQALSKFVKARLFKYELVVFSSRD